MSREMRMVLSAVVALMGLGLMVGGIIADKNGAVVGGMIVAGVAAQQFIAARKKSNPESK
jgi:hypothetical protein